MARHRLLRGRGPKHGGSKWAVQLLSGVLGVSLGAAFATACSSDDECGAAPEAIELGAFSVTGAQASDAALGALLEGPEPATLSIEPDRLRIDYRRNGLPVSVVYDVARKYE
jgi:hypothetical protein